MSVWEKLYERINWQNKPSRLTALGKSKLNIMDKAIDDLDDRVIELHTDVENNATSYVEFNNQNLAYNPDITLTMQSPDNTMAVFDTTGYTLNSSLYLKFKSSGVTTGTLSTTYKNGMASDSPVTISEGSNTITLASSDASDIANVKLTAVAGTFTEIMFCVNQNADYVPYYHSNRQLTHEIGELKDYVDEDIYENTTVTTSTDSETYLYRQSKAIGDREYLEYIDGGSLGWNQLVPDNKISFSNTTTDSAEYFYLRLRKNSSPYTALIAKTIQAVGDYEYVCTVPSGITEVQLIHSGAQSNISLFDNITVIEGHKYLFNISVTGLNLSTVGGFTCDNINLIDLTLALGPTVVDYVYSLEQATAGSGIAWLKEQGLFTDNYYAYDAGSIKSVNVSGHKMVGFNQWDEEWENGYFDASGNPYADDKAIRSKNFISVLPNKTYYLQYNNVNKSTRVYYYDENHNFISRSDLWTTSREFTTPNNCKYIKFFVYNANNAYSYNYDICINISNAEKNGTYEPYEEHVYPITSTDLRGIPKLTSDNKLGFDGDRYNANGRVDRKYSIVDLGTLNWTYHSESGNFYVDNAVGNRKATSNAICSCYEKNSNVYSVAELTSNGKFAFQENLLGRIIIRDTRYTDATTFKTALQNSNAQLVYEKVTPTTENATPIINPQICSPYGTEEFISDSPVPVPHSTEYYKTPEWMDVEPFKSERENNDSNTIKIANLSNMANPDIYSTTEKVVGEWIDGKPLYQKTIELGSLPNANVKYVNHNISSIDKIVSLSGVAIRTTDSDVIPLPFVHATTISTQVQLSGDTTKINIRADSDMSNRNGYVTIKYTKTTD